MLLNKHQKQKFIELYPVTPMPQLMVYYGTNCLAINNMAKVLGIYKSKRGKDKRKTI